MSKTTFLSPLLETHSPDIDPSAFIAPSADIMGAVQVGAYSSIWYGAVLRGDINRIQIGQRSNIQDACVLHLENDYPCIVGNDVTVGHRAILHACHVHDGVLVGMGATVLNGAILESGCVIAAGAVVKEHTRVPANTLWAGVPRQTS